ncbi:MAG: spermidine/putrescine ABC transporter substrate-binding protein [Anaerolineae bacterium]|nr:spermidine/putrescine ABC transporter substrate-binding protein [Anaerolineae bacterium]
MKRLDLSPLCLTCQYFVMLILLLVAAACSPTASAPDPTAPPTLATRLTIHTWEDDIPQEILDAFSNETGVTLELIPFLTYEEGVENIRGGMMLDVVWLSNTEVGPLIRDGLLAAIDYRNIPNARNIAANFRDLIYDPGNRHTVPFSWGTTGFVFREDLFTKPDLRWSDLWNNSFGPVGIWQDTRTLIGLTLKSLGYSVNSENPAELEAALTQMIDLKGKAIFLEDINIASSAYPLNDGQISLAFGWSYDFLIGQELNPNIAYIIPQDGSILWGDNIVIPANSPNKYTAEKFIDFMLRPEISALYTNTNFYATANDAAYEFIEPSIRSNPAIFPPPESLQNAEILMPLSAEGKALYDSIWARFMDAIGAA